MSLVKNLSGSAVPLRESRNSSVVTFNANNAECVLDVNGDESALVNFTGTSPVMTVEFSGSVDGTNYFVIPAYCLTGNGGTVPHAALALTTYTFTASDTLRVFAVRVAQFSKVRVRVTAFTSGSASCLIRSDAQRSQHACINDRTSSPLFVTNTAAVSTAVTATLPAVAGLRHYIDFIRVTRSATAALTAAATPVLVTTTNLPGSPVLTFGSDAGGIGVDVDKVLDFGGTGLGATAINTATTVVCPAYTGVIWRINIGYRLDL